MQKVGHPHCTLKYYREGCSHFMRHVLCLHRLSLLKIDNSLIALRKQLVLPVHGAVFEADGEWWLIIVVALDEFDLEDLQFVFADETVALLFSFAIRLLWLRLRLFLLGRDKDFLETHQGVRKWPVCRLIDSLVHLPWDQLLGGLDEDKLLFREVVLWFCLEWHLFALLLVRALGLFFN